MTRSVVLNAVEIFEPRRAALRAESSLTTVVHFGGGCCCGRGSGRRFSNFRILAAERNHFAAQQRVKNFHRLFVALARFLHAHADLGDLLRNSHRRADLDPAVGEMIEHGNFFKNPPRRVVRHHHAHDAETQRFGAAGDRRDQKIGRRAVGVAEMVLAEKDALETQRLGARPDAEICLEIFCHRFRIDEAARRIGQFWKKLEQPRFDHAMPPPCL